MTASGIPTGASGVEAASIAAALALTHEWFEVNSGWAPPDPSTLLDWGLEGIGRAPDECLVPERGVCSHGLASWQIVLDDLEVHDSEHVGALPVVLDDQPYLDHHTGGLTAP